MRGYDVEYDECSGPSSTVVQSQGQNVELVGQLGGSVWGVAVDGTYAYIGVGPA